MKDLFTDFTLAEIVSISIGILLAIKGATSFVVYFKNLYNEKFNKDYEKKQREDVLENHYSQCKEQHEQSMKLYNELENKLDSLTENINEKFEALDQRIDSLDERIDDLTTSDMHDIKQAITKDYHHFVEEQKWIDDFSLNCLEHRFVDYKKEGGNSFIEGMMNELRQLPRHAPGI